MKKSIILLTIFIFSLNVMAQQDSLRGKPAMKEKKYCAVMKDNKLRIMNEGNEITGPVTFPNGSKITTDATFVQSDGITRDMTAGECVDPDGNIIMPKEHNKLDVDKKMPDK